MAAKKSAKKATAKRAAGTSSKKTASAKPATAKSTVAPAPARPSRLVMSFKELNDPSRRQLQQAKSTVRAHETVQIARESPGMFLLYVPTLEKDKVKDALSRELVDWDVRDEMRATHPLDDLGRMRRED